MTDYVIKLTLVIGLLLSCLVKAQEPTAIPLSFTVNSPGSFPYLYFDFSEQTYKGLIPDFFAELEQQGIIQIEYVDSNQLRSEQFVIEGKVDLHLANREWLTRPDKVIASKPVIQHMTFLYSLTPFDDNFSLEALENKKICTQQEYIYTGLQPSFNTKKLQRLDSSNLTTVASMLTNERCDYAILNNYNATNVFQNPKYCHLAIYQSPQATSVIDLKILMRPELHKIKTIIDKHLQIFINSGKVDKSLLSHSPKPHFPKPISCETPIA